MQQGNEYVYKSTLTRKYGLPQSLINELGEPDKYVSNPHYRSGPEATLYLVERVEKWIEENQDRVDKVRATREKRSKAARLAHNKKREMKRKRALKWIRRAPLKIVDLPDDLMAKAAKHFGLRKQSDMPSEKGLLAYIRHHLSDYDRLRSAIKQREGWLHDELYAELRTRIDSEAQCRLKKWEQDQFSVSA